MPRVRGLLPQPTFSHLDVADDGAVVGAAPAVGYGAGTGQSQLLAAIALEDDITRMPLIDTQSADRDDAPYTFSCRVGLAGTQQTVLIGNLPG